MSDTYMDTLAWARSIPRAQRVCQGHTRIDRFARAVRRIRGVRALAQRRPAEYRPEREAILRTLQRVLDVSPALQYAARRTTTLGREWTPPSVVVWETGKPYVAGEPYVKYHWRNHGATGTVYHASTRAIYVPISWLIARLRSTYPQPHTPTTLRSVVMPSLVAARIQEAVNA